MSATPPDGRPRLATTVVVAWVAVSIALVVVAVWAVITDQALGPTEGTSAIQLGYRPEPPDAAPELTTTEPGRAPGTDRGRAGSGSGASGDGGDQMAIAVTARVATAIGDGVEAYAAPGAAEPIAWFPDPTQFGGPRVFLVLGEPTDPSHPRFRPPTEIQVGVGSNHDADWIEVLLPSRPNGSTGWIRRDQVEITEIDHRIEVDLSERTVTLYQAGTMVLDAAAVIGTEYTPTPTGLFYVRDVIENADPGGAYGSHIVALSGFSEVLETFAGGLPAIAIHGTDRPDTMGERRSNGCVRLPNELIEVLARVPLGTPVRIVP